MESKLKKNIKRFKKYQIRIFILFTIIESVSELINWGYITEICSKDHKF